MTLERIKKLMQEIDFVYVYGMIRQDLAVAYCQTNEEIRLMGGLEDEQELLDPTEENIKHFFDRFTEIQYEMLDGKYYYQMKTFLLSNALDMGMLEQLKQCFNSFETENYYSCVCGLFPLVERSILDSLHSPKYNWENLEKDFKKAYSNIIKKDIENDLAEYGTRLFIKKTAERVEFEENEPNRVNRNWILHGRSTRIPTKSDCLKLFNLIETIVRLRRQDDRQGN